MKHMVRKAFLDYEKEEEYLNQMSAQSLVLTDYPGKNSFFGKGKRYPRIII